MLTQILNFLTLHPAAYNPNTATLFIEVSVAVCALVAIGATIMVKEFIMRK
ncbi:hypothetical protein [Picrophilus oshimae]|uniref:Uncharacterized protein n=1 Tax=Picrophilus torridus (strain ATCC 700027 / DSM 9790 / JCM 10055 / NBRC 100828 / KAW 2/3) TaxID=1122961 RepID=A0A8G2L7F8_PICTO|nr:hypothetical protein [Picrophilus oshimae]SMD31048.1 hypothetical protein SAMN02745355_0967 [Picrophilus oshimae DSM 9789]